MYVTRFAVVQKGRNVILGRDLGGVFKPDTVYAAVKIDDEIIIKELGPVKQHDVSDEMLTINQIAVAGQHLLIDGEGNDI